ncbi:MAG: hypothetical protein RLZZ126_2100 [Pseudomonadota bacterium]|jgi:hypothetical protein
MADRYRLSFTTGGLFLQEAPIVVERYLALRDWPQTRNQVRNDNLLQVRTAAAALRISKELIARLELLESDELEELINGSARDRGYRVSSALANPTCSKCSPCCWKIVRSTATTR